MKNKLKLSLKVILPVLFWFSVWEILSLVIGNDYFLPSVPLTLSALWSLLKTGSFYAIIFMTLLRVIGGLIVGIALGVVLASLCHRFEIAGIIVTPMMSVVKSTPVATFIIVLWVLFTRYFSASLLAVFIAVLMVTPIVWQNTLDAYRSIDKNLTEVSEVFRLSYKKRMRLLVLPALVKYIFPAIITSTGLAWKSEIAAEIIAYSKNSLGQLINTAKNHYLSEDVFAITLVIILMSILLELGVKKLLGRYVK